MISRNYLGSDESSDWRVSSEFWRPSSQIGEGPEVHYSLQIQTDGHYQMKKNRNV